MMYKTETIAVAFADLVEIQSLQKVTYYWVNNEEYETSEEFVYRPISNAIKQQFITSFVDLINKTIEKAQKENFTLLFAAYDNSIHPIGTIDPNMTDALSLLFQMLPDLAFYERYFLPSGTFLEIIVEDFSIVEFDCSRNFF